MTKNKKINVETQYFVSWKCVFVCEMQIKETQSIASLHFKLPIFFY
jgi:hypothetical protein